MKLTESQLRQVIREELESLFSEGLYDDAMDSVYDLTGGRFGKPTRAKRDARMKARSEADRAAAKAAYQKQSAIDDAAYEKERKAKEQKEYEYRRDHPPTEAEKRENSRKSAAKSAAYDSWSRGEEEIKRKAEEYERERRRGPLKSIHTSDSRGPADPDFDWRDLSERRRK